MEKIIHARLDRHTQEIMRRLQRRHGWSDSDIIRQGVRALGDAELPPAEGVNRIAGLGKFRSGVDNLGSNKKHLQDFGR